MIATLVRLYDTSFEAVGQINAGTMLIGNFFTTARPNPVPLGLVVT